MTVNEFLQALLEGATRTRGGAGEAAGRAGAAAGTAAGGGTPQDIIGAITHPAPVAPGEALKQTEQGFMGQGPAAFLRQYGVWAIIVLVGLIGLWGLIAPGGGVAVIERARKG